MYNVCVRDSFCFIHDEYLPALARANVYVLCTCQCSSCVVSVCARVYVRRYVCYFAFSASEFLCKLQYLYYDVIHLRKEKMIFPISFFLLS